MKRRRPQLKSASDVLQQLFKKGQTPLSNEYKRWSLIHNWPKIVGEALAERTFPVKYFRGTLYVWCSSSSGAQHFYFFSDNLKEKVNEFIGKKDWVEKVIWTQNKGILDRIGEKERQHIAKLLKK